MITFLPHDLPKTESVVPVTHHTCLPSVQGYQEASENYRRNTTLPPFQITTQLKSKEGKKKRYKDIGDLIKTPARVVGEEKECPVQK